MQKKELKSEKKFKITPRQVGALLVTGHKLYQQGRWKDAESIFEGLSMLDPNIAYVHGVLGAIYQKEEKYEPAIFQYDLALNLFPGDVNSLTNRGELHLKMGRFDKAAADFKQAMQADPNKKNPAANRARLLVGLVQDSLQLAREQGLEAVETERRNAKIKVTQQQQPSDRSRYANTWK